MKSQNRRNKNREFRLESLEERRLLVYNPIGWDPGLQDSGYWSEQIINQASYQSNQFSIEELSLQQFPSKEATTEALHSLATEFWVDILGEELDESLWSQYQDAHILGRPVLDPWFVTEAIDFVPGTAADSLSRLESSYAVDEGLVSRAATTFVNKASEHSNLPFAVDDVAHESDLIGITDDNFMFLSQGEQVLVFDVSDATNIQRVTTIELGMYGRTDLFLTDQHLVSVNWNEAKVFDISDRAAPEFLSSMRAQQIVDSRLVGDSLFLTTSGYVNLPRPKFIEADWVDGNRVALSEESIGRFETAEEYVERIGDSIITEFLPNVDWSSGLTQAISTIEVGDWQDIVLATEQFRSQQTNVIRLDLDATDGPQVTESETVQGLHPNFMHFDGGGIFVVSHDATLPIADSLPFIRPFFRPSFQSNILHFDFSESLSPVNDAVGGINARHFAEVDGRVANASMLSSSDQGDLRVFSESRTQDPATWETTVEANLSIFRSDENGELVKVSELRDIADGQALYSGLFVGDKAFATTAEVVNDIPRWDPLHTFDLSDPLNPIEMSEIEIPGFTTQLEVASDNHLLGIGFARDAFGQWSRQIALYDIGDLSSPSVVTNWVAPHASSATWLNWWLDSRDVPFNADTGHLVVPLQESVGFGGQEKGAYLFEVHTDESPSIEQLGVLAPNSPVRRAEVFDDHIIVAGEDQLQVYALDQIDSPSQTILLGNPLHPDFLTIERGSQAGLPILSNDNVPASARIVEVSNTVAANIIRIEDDGRSLIYAANDSRAQADTITYSVEFEDGARFSSTVALSILPAKPPSVSEGSAKLLLSAINADGQAVTEIQRGDRFWLEIAVMDTRQFDEGVFGAYVDLAFDSNVFEIVSDPQSVEPFTNGIRFVIQENAITSLGGFSSSIAPTGPGIQRLVQIELEALQNGVFEFLVAPSQGPDTEVLLYGLDEAVAPENVEVATLEVNVAPTVSQEMADVNQDGGVTPQDALLIVNYLNQVADQARVGITTASIVDQQQMEHMDISGDGNVTPLDVLLIANVLNGELTKQSLLGEGEAEPVDPLAKDFQIDTSELERMKRIWGGLSND